MRSGTTAALAAMALSVCLPFTAAAAPAGGAYHIYQPNLFPMGKAPPAKTTMLYYGGPVISTTKVVVVLWGPNVPKATTAILKPFFKAITNSTYVDQLTQYSTVGITGVNGDPGTNQTIARGSFGGKFTITPSDTNTTLTDAEVQTELENQITAHHLPAADLNTLYMIYFPAGITITLGTLKSCSAFGAYHEAVSSTVTPNNIFYGVMPDCGYSPSGVTSVSSHEFAEATTDAIPTPGSNPAFPQAWNTYNGFEIGDLCEAYQGKLTAAGQTYTVQQVFLNSTHACSTGNYTSP
jgi:hypothetical protein